MVVKGASGCLIWSQSSNYWPISSSTQTLASSISSPSTRRRSLNNVAMVLRYVNRPSIFGTKKNKSRSLESKQIVRAANLNAEFSDEEFCREIRELALLFQVSDNNDNDNENENDDMESNVFLESDEMKVPDLFVGSVMEKPDWTEEMDMIHQASNIERKASSAELPFSLRMIQRKKQWKEGVKGAGESAYCSVKKAFSSLVFIIRELQSYTLQMREALFYEDLQGVLERVQKEMNASFVWLFQQVFSHTPTFMVYVMILLANYSVFAMSNNLAFAVPPHSATMESVVSIENWRDDKIDSSSIKTFPVSLSGKAASIGGINGGGGGNTRPVASGTDDEESFNGGIAHLRNIIPDGGFLSSTISPTVSGPRDYELGLWRAIVEEANKMQDLIRNGVLDYQTMQRFVSPVTAKVMEEGNDTESHFRMELLYQMGLSEEPNNPLLLANYAQFLYIVAQDYDRAEKYFKRASKVEPKDAEALSKYANFLLEVRKDLWAAEQNLLEAIDVDPINSFYAATYASFLWSNGPDDPCFPFDSPEMTDFDDL